MNSKFVFLTAVLIFWLLYKMPAQANEFIFPNLTGPELLDSLVSNYKTNFVYSYDTARDTLFSRIYMQDDSLTGVYSGYRIYLNPTEDPSNWAYNNGINTEHTWPQSKGAVGQAKSDMHHLFPTRSNVNSSRGNVPFAESPDQNTSKWWRDNYYLTSIPSQLIEQYSERNNAANTFEPREDHKGNVARAMFYFYTMYQSEANSHDPQFFEIQKEVLRQWHIYDPVDSLELVRNYFIADYQGGHSNPFILDSSLVQRAYFEPISKLEFPAENLAGGFELFQNFPNPFNSLTVIKYSLQKTLKLNCRIYNVAGQQLEMIDLGLKQPGNYEIKIDFANYPSGIYYYKINQLMKKMILLK